MDKNLDIIPPHRTGCGAEREAAKMRSIDRGFFPGRVSGLVPHRPWSAGRRERCVGRSRRSGAALLLVLLLGGSLMGCRDAAEPVDPVSGPEPGPDLLAFGDSYTVAHGLPEAWSWPAQLADSLAARNEPLRRRDVVAKTGWTTRDLLDALRDSLAAGRVGDDRYEIVTVMIGVNNQFRAVPLDVFAAELDTVVTTAIALAGGDRGRVIGFSIPNYGLTPTGSLYGTARVTDEIAACNRILSAVMAGRGVPVLDITSLSEQVLVEEGLVARDGLHYSREMYRRWVALMLPQVARCLDGYREGE